MTVFCTVVAIDSSGEIVFSGWIPGPPPGRTRPSGFVAPPGRHGHGLYRLPVDLARDSYTAPCRPAAWHGRTNLIQTAAWRLGVSVRETGRGDVALRLHDWTLAQEHSPNAGSPKRGLSRRMSPSLAGRRGCKLSSALWVLPPHRVCSS